MSVVPRAGLNSPTGAGRASESIGGIASPGPSAPAAAATLSPGNDSASSSPPAKTSQEGSSTLIASDTPESTTASSTPPISSVSATEPSSSAQSVETLTSFSIASVTDSAAGAASSSMSPVGAAGAKSFLQNKSAMAGVFSTLGIITLAAVVYFTTRALRRRRANKLDREIEEISFIPTSTHSLLKEDDDFYPSALHRSGSDSKPSQLASPDFYGYSVVGYRNTRQEPHVDYAYTAGGGPAGIGAGRSMRASARDRLPGNATYAPAFMDERRQHPQIVQPQRAHVYNNAPAPAASLAKVPSMSAEVLTHGDMPGPASSSVMDHMSNYATPPSSAESQMNVGSPPGLRRMSDIPLSPPLPNPHDQQHGGPGLQRVLKVANE